MTACSTSSTISPTGRARALLIVGTARPELLARRPGWGGGSATPSTVTVSALAPDETATLWRVCSTRCFSLQEVKAPSSNEPRGPTLCGGYVRMLQDRGFWSRQEAAGSRRAKQLRCGNGAGHHRGAPRLAEPVDKELVQNAAGLGKVFWTRCAGGLTGREPVSGRRELHGLERKEFVRRERRSAVAGRRNTRSCTCCFAMARTRDPRSSGPQHRARPPGSSRCPLTARRTGPRARASLPRGARALPGTGETRARSSNRAAGADGGRRAGTRAPCPPRSRLPRAALELTGENEPGRAGLFFTYGGESLLARSAFELPGACVRAGDRSGQPELAAEF